MRGTIKVIICSFLDLWFSNSILPSGKSKKVRVGEAQLPAGHALNHQHTARIFRKLFVVFLIFDFHYYYYVGEARRSEWWGKSSYPSCVQPLCPTRWSLVPFVICGLCFWFSISPNGRIGKVKVGENQGVCSSTSVTLISVGSSAVEATIYICSLWPGKIRDASTGPLVCIIKNLCIWL